MKKAKIVLSAIAVLGTLGSTLAFKAIKRSLNTYFTTSVYSAIPTQTLTHAITTPSDASVGAFKYFTNVDGDRARAYSKLTTASN